MSDQGHRQFDPGEYRAAQLAALKARLAEARVLDRRPVAAGPAADDKEMRRLRQETRDYMARKAAELAAYPDDAPLDA